MPPVQSRAPRKWAVYTYEVVTSNGCGVHAKGFKRCADARAAMERIAAKYSLADFFEIQRVEHLLPGSSRRYYMRKRSRWVPWRHDLEHAEREPDWHAISEARRV